MYQPVNDAQQALDHHIALLRAAEQRHLIRSVQPQQPNLLHELQSQLAAWTNNLPRPQRNRAQRA
jgi:hypothetical protein